MTQDLFLRWSWPGNIRELKNTIEGAFNIETSDLITLDSVQNLLAKMEQDHRPVPEEAPVRSRVEEPGSLSRIREQLSRGKVDLGQLLTQYEAAIISEALRQTSCPSRPEAAVSYGKAETEVNQKMRFHKKFLTGFTA